MGFILLGHGGLDVDPNVTARDMEFVAIPRGTVLRFFADSGQGVLFGSGSPALWEQLEPPWPALDASAVTYNLSLYSAQELWDEELRAWLPVAEHTLVRAGVAGVPDPLRMCTGTRATCPVDPTAVARGSEHTCDGVLGTYAGELVWVACTSFERARASAEERGYLR